MKVADLRKKNAADLRSELTALLREQFNLRMQKGSGQLAQTHSLKEVRRGIARIHTVLKEKGGAEA